MKSWKRIEPTVKTKIDYHEVIVKLFEQPDGNVTTRATFSSEDTRAAGVIALTKDNDVIIARQFRPGPEKIMNDIPGGYVEKGEEPEMAARRELLEETGYIPGEVTGLGEFSRDSYTNGRWYYFLATDCQRVQNQLLDYNEFVEVVTMSIDDFIASAKQGNMSDPFAVLAAYDMLKKIQTKEIRYHETTN